MIQAPCPPQHIQTGFINHWSGDGQGVRSNVRANHGELMHDAPLVPIVHDVEGDCPSGCRRCIQNDLPLREAHLDAAIRGDGRGWLLDRRLLRGRCLILRERLLIDRRRRWCVVVVVAANQRNPHGTDPETADKP